jgi:hypothetical protein
MSDLLSDIPQLVEQWDNKNNGKKKPSDYTLNSNKIVHWKCTKEIDHCWESTVKDKYRQFSVNKKATCPFCSGRRLSTSNCLATKYPEAVNQWHSVKNGKLRPTDLLPGSNKNVWWQCTNCNKEWQALVKNRKKSDFQLSCCTTTKKRTVNKINYIKIVHDLISLWHPTKNTQKLENLTLGSSVKVWWKCPVAEDHEWESTINSVVKSKKNGCPCCAGKAVVNSTSLSTTHPEIAKEWHPTKNGELASTEFTIGSGQTIIWQCSNNKTHIYPAQIFKRLERGCPYCSGQQVNKSNSLGALFPEIAKEWHPTKNGASTPIQYTAHSGQMIWWVCSLNPSHIWRMKIFERTRSNPRGCPDCAITGFNKSKPAIFYILNIKLSNGKNAIKFGITNQLDGNRNTQLRKRLKGTLTPLKTVHYNGKTAQDIENECKDKFGKKGYLTREELEIGYTETIKYSKANLNFIIQLIKRYNLK